MLVKSFAHSVNFVAHKLIRHINTTDEALYFLDQKWPYVEGQAHQQAVQICRDVLGGRGGPEKAREAFVRALGEGQFELMD